MSKALTAHVIVTDLHDEFRLQRLPFRCFAAIPPARTSRRPTGEARRFNRWLEFLGERLTRYKLPRSFEYVDQPLRDDAGKVRRTELRAARL